MRLRSGVSVRRNVGTISTRSRMRAVHASLLLCAPMRLSKQPQVIPRSFTSAQASAMMNETNIQKMAKDASFTNGVTMSASPGRHQKPIGCPIGGIENAFGEEGGRKSQKEGDVLRDGIEADVIG